MRSSATRDTFSGNQVTFVTFNYDRLIEHYFSTVLTHAFNLRPSEAEELRNSTIEIIHLHGMISTRSFGDYPEQLTGELLTTLAKGIRIIHDEIPASDPAFDRTYEQLKGAHQTCLLGFGYHPTNIARLQLEPNLGSNKLAGTAYGLRRAQVEMAKQQIGRVFITGGPNEKVEAFLSEHIVIE